MTMSEYQNYKQSFYIIVIWMLWVSIVSGDLLDGQLGPDRLLWPDDEEIKAWSVNGTKCTGSQYEMECRYNNITSLERFFIPEGTTLLDLSYNTIKSLTKGLASDELQKLLITHNQMENISSDALRSLPNLRSLDLSKNLLKTIPEGLFENSIHLESIVLSRNQISTYHHQAFPLGNRIIRLDLSHNIMTGIDTVEPSPIARLKNLKFLDLSQCGLDGLHVTFLEHNTQLKEINLSNNDLEFIPTTALYFTRSNLEFLDLSGNLLSTIESRSFHGLYGLKTLIVNNMPNLTNIEALAFHDLHSLRRLECENNPLLEYIHPKAFRDKLSQTVPTQIKILYLGNNNLQSLDEDLLDWIHLEDIDLSENFWKCNCEISWIVSQKWNLSEKMMNLICGQPQDLYGVRIVEIASSLTCDTNLGIGTVLLMAFISISLPVMLILIYVFIRRHYPNLLPRIQLLLPIKRAAGNYTELSEIH